MLKRLAKWLGLVVGSAAVVWIVVEQFDFDGTPESWLLLELLHTGPWYFEMVVDLEYDGRQIHIDRVVECKPKFARRSLFGYSPAWYQGRYAISERLPDGSGVMIVTPEVCRRNAKILGSYEPLIMWVDRADNPRMIEGYYDLALVRNGKARVQLKNIQIVTSTDKVPDVYPNDFADWDEGFIRDWHPSLPRSFFRTVYVMAVPESQWKLKPDLVAEVKKRTEPASFAGLLERQLSSGLVRNTEKPFLEGGWYPTREFPTLDTAFRDSIALMRDAYPLRLVEGELVPDWSAKGTLVYYNESKLGQSGGPGELPKIIRLHGTLFKNEQASEDVLWLPAENILFVVSESLKQILTRPR